MKKLILLTTLIVLQFDLYCQEPTIQEIVNNKIKSIIITEKETGNETQRVYNHLGNIEKEGNLVRTFEPNNKNFYVTTKFVYTNSRIQYKIESSSLNKDTTFFDYDSLGRLQFEFEQSTTYPKLTEYCYIVGYNKKDIHYAPYEIRSYRKPNYYFYSNNKKINYKNEGIFYLESYRRAGYDSNLKSENEFFFELCNRNQQDKYIDSFCLVNRSFTIKHSDSMTEIIELKIRDNLPTKRGEKSLEFSSSIGIAKTTLNFYSNKKLKHQLIKEFKSDSEEIYSEIEYRYNNEGLLIEKEEDKKYYFFSTHNQPIKSHSSYNYRYELFGK